MPLDVMLEGLYKSKLQDSVQLQTVLALYDQETVRNNGQTSYLRLKTSVKFYIDLMMRTRNFRVRNDVVERRSVTKSQKGKNAYVERKVGECFQWKDNVPKETHVVSVMTSKTLETEEKVRGEKDDRLLLQPNRRQNRLTAKKATKRRILTREVRFRAEFNIVSTRRASFGIFPCV